MNRPISFVAVLALTALTLIGCAQVGLGMNIEHFKDNVFDRAICQTATPDSIGMTDYIRNHLALAKGSSIRQATTYLAEQGAACSKSNAKHSFTCTYRQTWTVDRVESVLGVAMKRQRTPLGVRFEVQLEAVGDQLDSFEVKKFDEPQE